MVLEVLHSVRPMLETDLPRVHQIELASYDYPWSLGNFMDSLRAGYSMWVREANGEVIGYYAMMLVLDEAYLLNFTIAPSWRRHGLGRNLLEHCLACACGHRARDLFLEVRASNHAAIGLYRAHGFVDLAMRRGYYPAREGREDAIVMRLELAC